MQEKNVQQNENLSLLVDEDKNHEKSKFAKVLFTFEGRTEEELTIQAGEYIVVSNTQDNNGWWEVSTFKYFFLILFSYNKSLINLTNFVLDIIYFIPNFLFNKFHLNPLHFVGILVIFNFLLFYSNFKSIVIF